MMPDAEPLDWQDRANTAARSVTGLFGQRLLFLPGTHLAAVQFPSKRRLNLFRPWHYWWQAHYVDCLVDAGNRELGNPELGNRELGNGATPAARFSGAGWPGAAVLASRLVTSIWLRNVFTFVNGYYDDMAWLALATERLERLERLERVTEEARKPWCRLNARVRKTLTPQFDAASTDDLGGGIFWSKKRDFKNTPATAPVALYYARTGQQAKAQRLVDWLNATLFDESQGLYLDGARLNPAGEVVVEGPVYTYNQGPVLGALLELGGQANLARAAALVDAVAHQLTVPGQAILRCDGTGDGGLFTGILCRYLALAATDRRLPQPARAKAAELVTATAEGFWAGCRPASEANDANLGSVVFSSHAAQSADSTYPAGAVVELSTQLQAWMTIEAAAALHRPGN